MCQKIQIEHPNISVAMVENLGLRGWKEEWCWRGGYGNGEYDVYVMLMDDWGGTGNEDGAG